MAGSSRPLFAAAYSLAKLLLVKRMACSVLRVAYFILRTERLKFCEEQEELCSELLVTHYSSLLVY
ncbi:MAG: hypothetical protein ACUVR2_05080 [Anaerolineae bacterium]